MSEHPEKPAPGTVSSVVGTTSYGPGAGHGEPHQAPPATDGISSAVAAAQFLFTGVILAVVAGLMYSAGLNAGKGHGGGEGKPMGASPAAAVDVHALLNPTPELVAAGKNLFVINCASCHGTSGKGDGPAAVALNPKPRDFTGAYWRYGGGVARIVQTITTGSPGTAMAPFPAIGLADRFALAHYVRSFGGGKESDKPEDLAWLDQFGGGAKRDTTGGAAVTGGPAPGATIPIERALALLAEPPPPAGTVFAGASVDSGEGAVLFAARCASCHGAGGEGGVRTRMLGSAPYAYVTTRSFGAPSALGSDASSFERLVLRGLPGRMMPGNGDLSSNQIRALHSYVQSLRARQEATARNRS